MAGGYKFYNISRVGGTTPAGAVDYLTKVANAICENSHWSIVESATQVNDTYMYTILLSNDGGTDNSQRFFLRLWHSIGYTYVYRCSTDTNSSGSYFYIYDTNLDMFYADDTYKRISMYSRSGADFLLCISKTHIPEDLGSYNSEHVVGTTTTDNSTESTYNPSGTSSSIFTWSANRTGNDCKLIVGDTQICLLTRHSYNEPLDYKTQICLVGKIFGQLVHSDDNEKLGYFKFMRDSIHNDEYCAYCFMTKDGVKALNKDASANTLMCDRLLYDSFYNTDRLLASYTSNAVPYESIPIYLKPVVYNSDDALSGDGIGLKGYLDTNLIRAVSRVVCPDSAVGTTYDNGNFVLAADGILLGWDSSNTVGLFE